LSCVAPDMCEGIRTGPYNVVQWNGSQWSTEQLPGKDIELTDVSCSSSSFCLLVDQLGHMNTWNGRTWSSRQPIDPPYASYYVMSCSPQAMCMVVNLDHQVLVRKF
jgi:hypothetical protein